MAAIIVAMMAYTLILSMMLPAGRQAGPRPDMLIGGIPCTMDQIGNGETTGLRRGNDGFPQVAWCMVSSAPRSNPVCVDTEYEALQQYAYDWGRLHTKTAGTSIQIKFHSINL
jgi:hypothetical protein